jgi:hypothetical protein
VVGGMVCQAGGAPALSYVAWRMPDTLLSMAVHAHTYSWKPLLHGWWSA